MASQTFGDTFLDNLKCEGITLRRPGHIIAGNIDAISCVTCPFRVNLAKHAAFIVDDHDLINTHTIIVFTKHFDCDLLTIR